MTDVVPSVGRSVHYVSYGTPIRADGTRAFVPACRAATITVVHDKENVGLCILNPTGMFFLEECQYNALDRDGGTWHWPERV